MNVVFRFEASSDVETLGEVTDALGDSPIIGGESGEPQRIRRALLVGQPNVGKSVVFGALTGTYVTVSNYPGTTVEVTRGRARIGTVSWEVVDTPGTHNLVPMSEDEAVTRDILLSEPIDTLIQVGDAKNLARTLLLALQLAELGVPFCLDLNMADEARARHMRIDVHELERELPGVRVAMTTAIDGEGLGDVRAALECLRAADPGGRDGSRLPLPCAPLFPPDIEEAIQSVQLALGPAPVAKRALATMLLASPLESQLALPGVADDARRVARACARALELARRAPVFAILNRLRIERARAIVRAVQSRDATAMTTAPAGAVSWNWSAAIGVPTGLWSAAVVDGSLPRIRDQTRGDLQSTDGPLGVLARLLPPRVFHDWHPIAVVVGFLACVLTCWLMRRHARASTGAWKMLGAFVLGWLVCEAMTVVLSVFGRTNSQAPAVFGAIAGLSIAALGAYAADTADAAVSRALGRTATHPVWGVPILAVALLLAYEIVGVFGAGTAVNFFENDVFGSVTAVTVLDGPRLVGADGAVDVTSVGAERLVVTQQGQSRAVVASQVKTAVGYVADGAARIDVTGRGIQSKVIEPGVVEVRGDMRGAEARVWSGRINRLAYALFAWIGIPLLTAFVVGPYGILTMGITYAVAIVLPVVATFFLVFSILEDSGYLPRLAVMANRTLRTMGLNGKAVLPMVLGLGCDTMATLTARIMATRKERALVTLLLALGIPCSSQLSVIFALMQRTSLTATCVWLAVVLSTLLGVGWIAARLLPGESSDFLLEMPPIRRPIVSNIIAKTLARIEWYLREAVPLFLVGTALLFLLDTVHMLGAVHRLGEPIVHRVLGFSSNGGVADRVSEALVVGFLRRDFGAAGLLDMARAGALSPADVAVSMVTITLFIPCIANLFMIGKERGWKVAAAMSAFIFPYAVVVGAAVRFGFRVFGGS